MRTSIATVSLSGSLPEKLTAAAAAGFDGVELFENDLISCPLRPKEIRRRAEDLGLGIFLYQPFRDAEALPDELFARAARRAEQKFAVMEELGTDLLLVCSNISDRAIDDDELASEQLRALAAQASARGLRVAYEALAWGRHVNDYRHAWRVVRGADHPALGICLDSFHTLVKHDDAAGIRDIPGEKIFYLQLADAAAPGIQLDARHLSRHHRCFPGQGAFALADFTTEALRSGYRGPLSLEIFNDALRQNDPERTAVDGMRSLIALGDAVHATLPGQVTLPTLPAVSEPRSFALVELTVDAYGEQGVQDLLCRMGFTHMGNHRTKPVRLWQQGEARIVLNRTRLATDHQERGSASISTLGVEDEHAFRTAARAHVLMAPPTPRAVGPGEARLPAVTAPDGTSVYLCRTSAEDTWLSDFRPFSPGRTGPPDPSIDAIDHVALCPDADQFEEALLFYRTVFGLRTDTDEEIAEPHGLLRSRALAGGGVRLVLNVPALREGHDHQGLQHIAFSSADIFTTAERFRKAGVPLLAVPRNYYEDLAARTDLPQSSVERMHEHGILYDRHGDGEFYHLFTTVLAKRLFFEVVQRVDGYAGYGALNAPIRRAVQNPEP